MPQADIPCDHRGVLSLSEAFELFKEVADVSGLIVTKLDGSAKGGVVITLADTFGLPVHAVGVGEGADDLQPFEARDFANALAGVPDDSA